MKRRYQSLAEVREGGIAAEERREKEVENREVTKKEEWRERERGRKGGRGIQRER